MYLIADFDLFANVGGGQTSYRAIVERSPQREFIYFTKAESAEAPRPPNAKVVPYDLHYRPNTGDIPQELAHFYSDYLEAWQLAASVAAAMPGAQFDAIDIPDYRLSGLFLASALRAHGIHVGATTIALHGTISSALRCQWPNASAAPRKLAELRMRERLQYRAADGRYALSEAYADEWKIASGGHAAHIIDPLLIVGEFAPVRARRGTVAPDLLFVGRRERRKGPDLFLDIAWMVERSAVGAIKVIGGDAISDAGVSSEPILKRMAAQRNLELSLVERATRPELDAAFADRSVVVLPSRYDQFNLVALEALRLGCPTFVSDKAGVARWIRSNLPKIADDLVFPLSAARAGAARVRSALVDYDRFRDRLVEALDRASLKPAPETLSRMYDPADRRDTVAAAALAEITGRLDSFLRPREEARVRSHVMTPSSPAQVIKQRLLNSPLRGALDRMYVAKQAVVGQLRSLTVASAAGGRASLAELRSALSDRSSRALGQIKHARDMEGIRQRLLLRPERTQAEIVDKLRKTSSEISEVLVGRAHFYREMARLERKKRGGDIVAATYELRLMRWLGEDRYDRLSFVADALEAGGFRQEGGAARAMMTGSEEARFGNCLDLLNAQYENCKIMPVHRPEDFVTLDDRRGKRRARTAVIVSLYNAASKLGTFLDALGAQTIVQAEGLEIVLIDSGSPTDEARVAKAFMDRRSDLQVVFARTRNRETIQAAWNRGIALSRAPYLAFLGVDEALHPDGLRVLASELDSKPGVDWVMADSVVTEVDKSGAFVSDVMTYDRSGYAQFLTTLETCYLSWVGGLYRRSIHERFGAYDAGFRAAGDTEFKARLLPRLETARVPSLLGVFNNYPEERTTQHPRAEIEDLRAWYLPRTQGGMAYLFDKRPIGMVEDAFRICLSYRKSYLDYRSTDFDVAHSLAQYMSRRGENEAFARAAVISASAMLQRIRTLEELSFLLAPEERERTVAEALFQAKEQEAADQAAFGLMVRPHYEIFNDNRYEQHWYSWSG